MRFRYNTIPSLPIYRSLARGVATAFARRLRAGFSLQNPCNENRAKAAFHCAPIALPRSLKALDFPIERRRLDSAALPLPIRCRAHTPYTRNFCNERYFVHSSRIKPGDAFPSCLSRHGLLQRWSRFRGSRFNVSTLQPFNALSVTAP
jgi:hypothetical protein